MFILQCPHCQKSLKVKEGLAGQREKCTNCGQLVQVPVEVHSSVPSEASMSAQDARTLPPSPKLEISDAQVRRRRTSRHGRPQTASLSIRPTRRH